jgi:hypothetical protein
MKLLAGEMVIARAAALQAAATLATVYKVDDGYGLVWSRLGIPEGDGLEVLKQMAEYLTEWIITFNMPNEPQP